MTTGAWIMLVFAIVFLGGGFGFGSYKASKNTKK